MRLRSALGMAIFAALLFAPSESAAHTTATGDGSFQGSNAEDLPPLPLSSRRLMDLLSIPPPRSGPPAGLSCVQWPSSAPRDCRQVLQERQRRSHTQQLQNTLHVLSLDKKHGVHVYLQNNSQLRGRLAQIGDDSFSIRAAKGKPDVEFAYNDVSWVTKEPTGGEKFGRGLKITGAMIVLAPLIIPLALLFAAGGGDC